MVQRSVSFLVFTYFGLYRDGGLSATENANRHNFGCLRKDVIAIFHNEGLKTTINTNLTTTDFLDVTLDLFTGKYFPYRKPNNSSLYVNANSNHPPNILEQLLTMLNICLSSLSINEDEFS